MQIKYIDFFGKRWIFQGLSIILILISLISFTTKGINFGLEFTGGNQIQITSTNAVNIELIRDALDGSEIKAVVKNIGNDKSVVISTQKPLPEKLLQEIILLNKNTILDKSEYIGPQIGSELAQKGIVAVLVSVLCTMLYIAIRFEYRLAVSSAIALAHDPIIIMGIFSIFGISFDLTTLAALLAVVGYSLNDTIVVFDRARENFLKPKNEEMSPASIMNNSISQTLSRTLITSFLTFTAILVLYIFGGPSLQSFALCMLLGVIAGTYSSIMIAGNLAVQMGVQRSNFIRKSLSDKYADRP
jgi:preprotein translocase subunit SecF